MTMGWDQAETGMEGDSGELFAATKGAVMAFTRSLALSLAPASSRQCACSRLDQDRLGQLGLTRLARSSPPRDPPGPLGHPRRRRPRCLLSRQSGRGVRDRAGRADKWRSRSLETSGSTMEERR